MCIIKFRKMKTLRFLAIALFLGSTAFAQDFNPAVRVNVGNEDMLLRRNASPFYYDFDKDGKKDMLVGGISGRVRLYKNLGSKSNPAFDEFEYLKAAGEDIRVPNY